MAQIREFGPEFKAPIPGQNFYGAMIQLPAEFANRLTPEQMQERFLGRPIITSSALLVVAHYYEPHNEMTEHDSPNTILFLVTGGNGFVRLGGVDGETIAVRAGMAVVMPPKVLHKVWAENEPLQGIIIEYPEHEI